MDIVEQARHDSNLVGKLAGQNLITMGLLVKLLSSAQRDLLTIIQEQRLTGNELNILYWGPCQSNFQKWVKVLQNRQGRQVLEDWRQNR